MSFTRVTTSALSLSTNLSIKVQPVLPAYYESPSALTKEEATNCTKDKTLMLSNLFFQFSFSWYITGEGITLGSQSCEQ